MKQSKTQWLYFIADLIGSIVVTATVPLNNSTNKAIVIALWVITAIFLFFAVVTTIGDSQDEDMKKKHNIDPETKMLILDAKNHFVSDKELIKSLGLLFALNFKVKGLTCTEKGDLLLEDRDTSEWKSPFAFKAKDGLYDFHKAAAYYEKLVK